MAEYGDVNATQAIRCHARYRPFPFVLKSPATPDYVLQFRGCHLMLRVVNRLSAFFLFFFLLLPAAWGQYGSSLQGVITDQSGAAINGAKVTATNNATGVARDTVTNSAGFYRISGLTPGSYSVAVEATSFQTKTTTGVTVQAELARGLDVNLQP